MFTRFVSKLQVHHVTLSEVYIKAYSRDFHQVSFNISSIFSFSLPPPLWLLLLILITDIVKIAPIETPIIVTPTGLVRNPTRSNGSVGLPSVDRSF